MRFAKHDTQLPRFIVFCLSRLPPAYYPILSPYIRRSVISPTVSYLLQHCSGNTVKTARTVLYRPIGNAVFACPVMGVCFPNYDIVNYYNRVKNRGVFVMCLIFKRLSQKIVASALICKSKH